MGQALACEGGDAPVDQLGSLLLPLLSFPVLFKRLARVHPEWLKVGQVLAPCMWPSSVASILPANSALEAGSLFFSNNQW